MERRREIQLATPSIPTKYQYLLLSAITGLLELGAPIAALRNRDGVLVVVAMGLLYQVGTFSSRMRFVAERSTLVCVLGTICAASEFYLHSGRVAVLLTSILLLASSLQSIRQIVLTGASEVSTWLKRTWRIGGFVAAGAMSVSAIVGLGVLITIACRTSKVEKYSVRLIQRSPSKTRVLMLVHQMHYFCYAYVLIWQFAAVYNFKLVFVGLSFACGWVSYTVTPLILRQVQPKGAVVLGHIWTALLLVLIATSHRPIEATTLWILTGFGGGTVFGVRAMCKQTGDSEQTLDHWEEVGHVAGACTGLILATINPVMSLYGASSFAIVVAAITLTTASSNVKAQNL